jgi:hypothetical protein
MIRRLLLVVGIVVAIGAFPGRAMAVVTEQPSGSISAPPSEGFVVTKPSDLVVQTSFKAPSNASIDDITLNVSRQTPQGGSKVASGDCKNSTECGSSAISPWPLTYNGSYAVVATASCSNAFNTCGPTSLSRAFSVGIPPARAATPTVTRSDKGVVSVSWAPNPEPDIKGYELKRTPPGSTAAQTYAAVAPDGTNKLTFTDPDAAAPGTYAYTVVAHRFTDSSQPADKAGDLTGPESASSSVVVPAAGSSATTVAGGGSSDGSGGGAAASGTDASSAGSSSSSSAAAAQAGKVDLKGFAAMLDKARQTGKVQVVEPPDPGFQETLPFKPGDKEDGTDTTEVLHQTVPGIHAKSAQRPALLFVAGSLLATVLLMHLLWLKSEVRRAGPLESVTEP